MFLWTALATVGAAEAAANPYAADTGISWWQTIGGLVLVFGLLIVSLRLLGKWNRRSGGAESNLLMVWHLGPKREIQLLRLMDEVHYIYRHDGSMVVLKAEPVAEFERKKAAEASAG
jgi:hypothetical protein